MDEVDTTITKSEAKTRLLNHMNSQRKNRSKIITAEELNIGSITSFKAMHFVLETFCENRVVLDKAAPCDTEEVRPRSQVHDESPQAGTSNGFSQAGTSNDSSQAGTSNDSPQAGTSNGVTPQAGTSNGLTPQAGTSNGSPQAGTSNDSPQAGTSNDSPQAGTSNGMTNDVKTREGRADKDQISYDWHKGVVMEYGNDGVNTMRDPYEDHSGDLWEESYLPGDQFKNESRALLIPGSHTLKDCDKCKKIGEVKCKPCFGKGYAKCLICKGKGEISNTNHGQTIRERCTVCDGHGLINTKCGFCKGHGKVNCTVCKGHRKIHHYMMKIVRFTNHVTQFIIGPEDFPLQLVCCWKDYGYEFEDSVNAGVPDERLPTEVKDKIRRLLDEARKTRGEEGECDHPLYPSNRKLNQRQRLIRVPVIQINYTYKGHSSTFWLYGDVGDKRERCIYVPGYKCQSCPVCEKSYTFLQRSKPGKLANFFKAAKKFLLGV